MENLIDTKVLEQIIKEKLRTTCEFPKCSYITPDGEYLDIIEHYEAHKFLVVEELVACPSDAEQLLSDAGYVRYSWIGYLTLPNKEPTEKQYKKMKQVFEEMQDNRDDVCIQIQNQPKFYTNLDLKDIDYIIEKIKYYYQTGIMLEIH